MEQKLGLLVLFHLCHELLALLVLLLPPELNLEVLAMLRRHERLTAANLCKDLRHVDLGASDRTSSTKALDGRLRALLER